MTDSSSTHCDYGDAVSSTQQSPGNMLRAARESAGLSREELSQRLCIIDNTVEWLEDDIYERQLEAVYVRGYIRNICRELGIPSKPVLEAYEAAGPQPHVHSEKRHMEKVDALRPARKRGLGLLALLPLMAAGGVFWWLYDGPVKIPEVSGSVAPVEEVVLASAGVQVPSESSTEAANAPESVTTQLELRETAAEAEVETVPPNTQIADKASVSQQNGLRQAELRRPAESVRTLPTEIPQLDSRLQGALRLSFDEDSWVEVKDAGGVVLLAGVQQAGTSKALNGRAPFDLMLGNARATRVVYREQRVESEPVGNRRTRRLIVSD